MTHQDISFRFLDLPKEIRLMVYERFPRSVSRQEVCIHLWFCKEQPHQRLYLIIRSIPMAILRLCRQVNNEATTIVQHLAKNFILLQPARIIYEAQDHFNESFLFWILDAISEQAHRRVREGIRYTVDNAAQGWSRIFHQVEPVLTDVSGVQTTTSDLDPATR